MIFGRDVKTPANVPAFYSSLFTHFYPEDWDGEGVQMDAHFWIPTEWDDVQEEGGEVT